mgnify:CR=1 FL=1
MLYVNNLYYIMHKSVCSVLTFYILYFRDINLTEKPACCA